MPTKVQSQSPEPHPYDKVHDPHLHNKNWVHREALQLAIGSILTPKRTYPPPYSRSTSGSPSPAYSYSPSTTPGTGTPVHHYPNHPQPFGSEYLHPHHPYVHHQHSHHTPSKLAQSSSNESSPRSSSHPSPVATKPHTLPSIPEPDDALRLPPARHAVGANELYDPPPSPGLGPIADSDSRLKPLRPTITPLQPQPLANGAKSPTVSAGFPTMGENNKQRGDYTAAPGSSTPGTPKAKFFEALQGKGAWDALIHGSFS